MTELNEERGLRQGFSVTVLLGHLVSCVIRWDGLIWVN
jgi:hypothetical protein